MIISDLVVSSLVRTNLSNMLVCERFLPYASDVLTEMWVVDVLEEFLSRFCSPESCLAGLPLRRLILGI